MPGGFVFGFDAGVVFDQRGIVLIRFNPQSVTLGNADIARRFDVGVADAARRFSSTPDPKQPAPARAEGFQAVGDIFGTLLPKAAPAKASEAPPATEQPAAPAKPATPRKTARSVTKKPEAEAPAEPSRMPVVFDYRNDELPERVRDLIEAHLAIEAQDAKSAGTLGFMTRSLAITTLPHRKTENFRFVRRNGDFTLTMMTAHPKGLPYGTLPHLLLTWESRGISGMLLSEIRRTGDAAQLADRPLALAVPGACCSA